MRIPSWSFFVIAVLAALASLSAVPAGAQVGPTDATERESFLVFFDWGKPELRDEAKASLDRAAQAFAASPGARLRLDAHTDRSGGAAVNQRSAKLRAVQVRDYLVSKGVPAARISLHSFGEERPLVPTADDVREVQNRRVEVIVEPASGR